MSARSEPSGSTTNGNGESKSNELAEPAVIAQELDWSKLLLDATLVRQAQAGDREALNLLLHRHLKFLLNHARRHCGDCGFVEDLCQEGCLKAIAHLDRLRNLQAPDAFCNWVRAFIFRELFHCRRNCIKVGTARLDAGITKIEGSSVESANHSTEELAYLWSMLWQQVGRLGRQGCVAAFMLEFYDQHEEFPTVRTIAEATHSSHGTAERRRHAVLCAWQRALTALNLYP